MNRVMKNASVLVLCSVFALPGCGQREGALKRELTEVKQELSDLNESHKALNQRYENLQDRLALIEDRQEGNALLQRRKPQLPVVRVVPPPPSAPAAPELPPATITQDDIDRLARVRSSKAPGPRSAVTPPANAVHAGNVGVRALPKGLPMGGPRTAQDDPIAAYKHARALYNGGNLPEALRALKAFTVRWPEHGYTDNALYLIGSGRFKRAEYRGALAMFRRVLSEHASGNQVPDALLMTGLTLEKLGKLDQAMNMLSRLKAMYPNTSAAQQAGEALMTFGRRR